MEFGQPPERERRENIVPMINVVFLLLIFFLMTAQIAPPPPFEATPPETAAGAPAEQQDVLHVAADGMLAFGDARGDAVFAALAGRDGNDGPLMLRADGDVPAARIAELLPRLAAAGQDRIELVTVAR